jgi:hypothetical protein
MGCKATKTISDCKTTIDFHRIPIWLMLTTRIGGDWKRVKLAETKEEEKRLIEENKHNKSM